jgi:hypothetical protein
MSQTSSRAMASTHTRLAVGIDPSTDAGRAKALRYGASECLLGAMKLDEGFPDLTGEYILTFHALELAFKAFLAKNGVTNDDLQKKYSHNLVSLYKAACNRGLIISFPDIDNTLAWINEYHGKGALLRYDFTNPRELPMCATLFPLVNAVLSASK